MTWMTIEWPTAVFASVTRVLIHLRTELRAAPQAVSLFFSLSALAVAVCANAFGGVAAAADTDTNVPTFVVKSWRTIDGLPQNSVMALAQTTDGYLWLGTRGGLARFDGVRFTTYGLADGLKAASIWCLADDGQGGLWIGTLGGGLSRWHDGAISTLTTGEGLAHNDVTALAPAEAGALWVGSKGGLQHLGPGGFTRVGEAEGIRSTVMALVTDRAGGLWVATFLDGLFYCKDGRCEPVEGPPEQRRFLGYSLVVDTEGALWVSIGNGMVLRRQAEEWTVFNETHGLPFSFVRCLAQGAPGEIWAASSEEGLYVFRAGRFHAVPGTEAAVRSVRMSRDGVIWVGTFTRGLFRLTTGRLREYPVGRESLRPQVNGLVEESPGNFLVATDGTGLHQGSLDRLERVVISKELERFPNLTAGLRLSDGTVYFGGAAVLLRREPTTGEIRKMSPTNNVTALCEGADGALWLGTREGQLLRWVDNTLHTVTNGTFPGLISGLVRGPGSSLWVAAARAGLFHWEAGHVQRWTTQEGLPTDAVRTLHQDAAGTLWIGTAGGGLAWLEAGHMHSVNSRQGLGDDFISQILEDDQGNLWLGCNLGIFRVSKRELQDVAAGLATTVHPLALGEADGMLVPECSGGFSPAGLRSRSGTLYFTTLLGVLAVDPARFGPLEDPPTVLIEEVMLDGKPLPLRGGALSLPPGLGELEIQYTAFNFAKPEFIRFRRRLVGMNEEWTDAGKVRSIRFSRLRPGDYVFQLSAANQDGRWNETGATVAFTVQPFYWQTIWFRILVAIGLIGGGAGSVWAVVRGKFRRHREELAHQRALSEREQRVDLAATAAHLGIWERDLVRHEIWASDQWRSLFGFERHARLDFETVLQRVHPDDREPLRQVLSKATRDRAAYEAEYRIMLPDGRVHWIASRGRVECDRVNNPILVRGVSMDITERRRAEQELAQQRNEVAHLSRVTTLGEISGSLAHELSQPLGAILTNTDAAEFHLKRPTPNLNEVRAILADIRKDDMRAGEIIHGMRAFLRRRELEMQLLEVDQLAGDAVRLVSADALTRKITIGLEIAPALPRVLGDRIHLQQVLVNLLVNGMDALDNCTAPYRRITIRATQPNSLMVEIAVSDAGAGIPPGDLSRVFDAFHTTKKAGLGLGLAICRSIVEAHGGAISIENNLDRGATARFTLPVSREEPSR